MKMILAPLDFSDATPRVVDEAAALAMVTDAHVVLLHVGCVPKAVPHHATVLASLVQARSAIEAAAEQQLARIKEDLRTRGIAAHMLRLTGEPSSDIVAQAEKLAVDYIVLGSHGHSAIYDLVCGSTTSGVIRRSKRAVVVVPAPNKSKDATSQNSGDSERRENSPGAELPRLKTILAAIDFSPVTTRVVAAAAALARASQARLILLNVTTPSSLVQDYAALESVIGGTDPERPARDGALSAPAIHGESLQIIGEPVDVILKQAALYSADYIVMGSHGHTALFELVVGGTAAGVMRRTRCPVILIPSLKRKEGKSRKRSLRRRNPVGCLQRVDRPGTESARSSPKRGRWTHSAGSRSSLDAVSSSAGNAQCRSPALLLSHA